MDERERQVKRLEHRRKAFERLLLRNGALTIKQQKERVRQERLVSQLCRVPKGWS